MPDLAAIIEEAAAKIALYDRVGCMKDGAPAVIVKAEIVARLLAVAKAAVEMREASGVKAHRAACAAFDAAVRGEGKEEANGR